MQCRSKVFAVAIALVLFLSQSIYAAQFKPVNPGNADRSSSRQQNSPATNPEETQQPATFSVGVNLVRVLVTVRNQEGGAVTNLSKSDFQLTDEGTPQDIAIFERNTSLPLSVAVMIDTSASTRIDLHYEEESVLKFVPALLNAGNPSDTFALYSFNWRTNLEADFSRSQRRAERVLHSLRGEGGTSLYDAIYLASDNLAGREGRHVMVIVTDGNDTTSYKRFDDALKAAQRTDCVLYPIVTVPIENDAGRAVGGEHALASLAAATGGRIFFPAGFAQLDQAFTDIIKELRTQYLLGFYPKGVRQGPNSFHSIKVSVKDQNLRLSSRSGYYEP